jgi:GxxExxY protein
MPLDPHPLNELSGRIVEASVQIHRDLGPGLLESVYESILAHVLRGKGMTVDRQVPVGLEYAGVRFAEAFRADLVVNGAIVIEVKSVESHSPVHAKMLLTYLRLMGLPLGLLINFGAPLLKDGIRRIVNDLPIVTETPASECNWDGG